MKVNFKGVPFTVDGGCYPIGSTGMIFPILEGHSGQLRTRWRPIWSPLIFPIIIYFLVLEKLKTSKTK